MVFEKIKQLYYSLEEKWYDLIEKLNAKIPVNGLIDSVDKFAPSFLVFLSIIFLLLIFGSFILFFSSQQEYSFRVTGENGNSLQNVLIGFSYNDFSLEEMTNDSGELTVKLPSSSIFVNVSHDGFEDFSSELSLKKDEVNEIILTVLAPQTEQKFLSIVDEDGAVISQPVLIIFSCSQRDFGPSIESYRRENGSEFSIDHYIDCGGVTASISSNGFEDKESVLSATRNTIELKKRVISLSSANISVNVLDKLTKQGVQNIAVKLISIFPIEREVNEGRTSSSGNYAFEANPGKYFVSAIDLETGQYKSNESSEFEIEDSESKSLTIELEKNFSQKNKLLLKTVDSVLGQSISNATVVVFDGNLRVDSKQTAVDGIVSFSNLDENKDYFVVVSHANYALKVFSELLLVDKFSSDFTQLSLDLASPLNSGKAKVTVTSSDGENVSGKKVLLKNSLYPFWILQSQTDSNGIIFFNNLFPGNYKAFVETPGYFAQSEEKNLLAGQTIDLSVDLVLKQGFLKVKVFDRNSVIIAGARVQVIDALFGDILSESTVNSSGETEKISLPWNKQLYLKVTAGGFLDFYSAKFLLSPNATKNLNVFLYRENQAAGFDVLFERLLDFEAKNNATSFSRDMYYYLDFSLIVPQSGFGDIKSIVRTGLQNELNSSDSNFVITAVQRPLSGVQAVFSGCFNSGDDFSTCNPVNENAKQLNLDFGNLSKGVYQFLVKVYVKPSVLPSQLLELRYAARSSNGQSIVRKPNQETYIKQFFVGLPVTCNGVPPLCPSFAYFFDLSDSSGLDFSGKKQLLQGAKTELFQGLNYSLEYKIFNLAKPRQTFSNFNLNFFDKLDTNAIEITPTSIQVPLFEPDTSFSGQSVTIQTVKENGLVELETSLDVPVVDNKTSLVFNVVPKKFLSVEVAPLKIYSSVFNYLSVRVKDTASQNSVNNAIIKFSMQPNFAEPFLIHTKDGNNGSYVVEIPPLTQDGNVYVLVEAFNYRDSNVKTIEVSNLAPTFDLTSNTVNCVVVNDNINDSKLELSVVKGQKVSFSIESKNCFEPVQVYVYQKAASAPLTIENLSNLSVLSESVSPSFELANNQKVELRVSADKLVGEYALFIKTRFASDTDFSDTARLTVLVRPQAGSCLTLNKTSFNVLPTDEAIITNDCSVFVRDPFYPRLVLGNEKASLDFANQNLFENQEFTVESKIFGSMASIGETSRRVNVSVRANDADPHLGEQTNAQGIFNSLLQGPLAICLIPQVTPICLTHPELIGLILLYSLNNEYSQQLGSQYNTTCVECDNQATTEGQLLLGTKVDKVEIVKADFDEGHSLKINANYVGIPGTGPTPTDNENSSDQQSGSNTTPLVPLATGLQGLPFGGGGFPGGGGGPLGIIMQILNSLTGGQQTPVDSCGGRMVESTDCQELYSDEISGTEIDIDYTALFCTNIQSPINVTSNFVPGLNSVELLVCNKIGEGQAEVEFEIEDSVDFIHSKNYSFVPEKDITKELDTLNLNSGLYFFTAPSYSNVSSSFSTDKEDVEAFFDGKKVRSVFVGNELFSMQNDFQLINTSLEGEEFALLDYETFAGEQPNPLLDVVLLVDSSNSFKTESSVFCEKKSLLLQELSLRGVNVSLKAFSIGQAIDLPCFDGVATWGDSIQPTDNSVLTEAWGPSMQDLIRTNTWRENAEKFVIVFTDTTIEGFEDESALIEINNFEDDSQDDEVVDVTGGPGIGEIPVVGESIISNTTLSVKDNNVFVGFVFGTPVENQSMLAEFDQVLSVTKGFVKSYQSTGDEKLLADFILKSAFEVKKEQFHVRLIGGTAQLCSGPNNELGKTGSNALPNVLMAWDWTDISESTCDQTGLRDYVYCDAAQFSKELVKKLVRIKGVSASGEFGEINSLTTFNSFLLKDSFSNEFLSDFDEFVKTKEFLPLNEYVQDWSKYFSNPSRFSIFVEQTGSPSLTSTGLYQVNIRFVFDEGNEWVFFDSDNQPTARIEVKLKLLEELKSTNPLYNLAFDGMVGLQGEQLNRLGYGVGYGGDFLELLPQTTSSLGLKTYDSTGLPLANISVNKYESFDYLNKENPGVLLSIQKSGSDYVLNYAPSYATPVIMEAISNNGKASVFYEVKNNSSAVPSSGFLNKWSGAASNILECKDFEGNNLPLNLQDSHWNAASCVLQSGVNAQNAFGFNWNAVHNGKVFIKTVFYTPTLDYTIMNACQQESLVITPAASSAVSPLQLSFGSSDDELNLKRIFDLVKEEKVCVGEDRDRVRFWWNKKYLFDELQKNADNYFNAEKGANENFRQCVVG